VRGKEKGGERRREHRKGWVGYNERRDGNDRKGKARGGKGKGV